MNRHISGGVQPEKQQQDDERQAKLIVARSELVWTSFTYITAVMALLYVLFTGMHYALMRPDIRDTMVTLSMCSVLANLALFFYFFRTSVSPRLAHPLATLCLSIILINSAAHLYLTDTPRESTNFMLLLISCGLFLSSTRWLVTSVVAISATWVAVALARNAGEQWIHFGIFVGEAAIIAILAHVVRMRTLDRLLQSQWENEVQRKELTHAITEKDRAQERLQRLSEASFEAIFLHYNGQIVDVNEQAARIFGYSREEFLKMHMDSLVAPEVRTPSQFKRKTLHSATGSQRDGNIHQSVALHKDGHRFSIEFGALQQRPGSHHIDAAVIRDITARQRLEHLFRDFVENAVDYFYEIDGAGRFTYANGATKHLLVGNKSLIGEEYFQFVHVEHRERVRKQIKEQDFLHEPVLYQEYRIFARENDMERWVGQIIQPVVSGHQIIGYRMVARNVTDRVMAVRQALTARREAEEANRSKSRFLSSMSHELRTPMNGIMGFAQLLNEEIHGSLNEQQHRDVDRLMDCSNHLLTLIEDLLDLSKADMNAITLRRIPMSAKSVVDESIDMIQRSARKKNVSITAEIHDDVRVKSDPRRLRQILLNLLSNAVKYSPEGSQIEITAQPTQADEVTFIVADRGPGVPTENQEKIFTEFFQSDHARDSSLGGSGIGLTLVRKLVSLHDGEVGYRDRSGGGSEFWFTLERTLEEIPALAEDPTPRTPGQQRLTGRILVVDDVEVNTVLLQEALTNQGHTVQVAYNGQEAIEQAEVFRPDLIFMDMRMPVLDGFQATQKLKSKPAFAATPIVALTASVSDDDIADCLSSGCIEHLNKPVQLSELFDCVERNLSRQNIKENGIPNLAPDSRPLRVLVAEDIASNRDFMAAFFQRLPDSITFVSNGQEAVEAVANQDFDVVLMDVQMPEVNGLEATRQIRKSKDGSQLPVVGLSGLGAQDDIQECLAAGMNDFITKPVRFRRIVEVLDQYRGPSETPIDDKPAPGQITS